MLNWLKHLILNTWHGLRWPFDLDYIWMPLRISAISPHLYTLHIIISFVFVNVYIYFCVEKMFFKLWSAHLIAKSSHPIINKICLSAKKWYRSGSQININMSSYQYRKSHCGDKTVVRSSYLHNGISYTGKMSSLYWIKALVWGESWDTIVISKRIVTADGVAHIWHQCIFRDHNHGLNRPVYVTTVLNKWHICELLQTFDNLFHNKTVVSSGSCAVSMGMLWLNCLTFHCFCFCEKGLCSWNSISCNQAIHIWRVINVP